MASVSLEAVWLGQAFAFEAPGVAGVVIGTGGSANGASKPRAKERAKKPGTKAGQFSSSQEI